MAHGIAKGWTQLNAHAHSKWSESLQMIAQSMCHFCPRWKLQARAQASYVPDWRGTGKWVGKE